MAKGLKISFQVNDSKHEENVVMHLANLTVNEIRKKEELQWRIFTDKTGENRFFKGDAPIIPCNDDNISQSKSEVIIHCQVQQP